jgi:hypothetical protein
MVMLRIDIDNDALASAARALGTATRNKTINAALREVCAHGPGPALAGARAAVADGWIGLSVSGRGDDAPGPEVPPTTGSAPEPLLPPT